MWTAPSDTTRKLGRIEVNYFVQIRLMLETKFVNDP